MRTTLLIDCPNLAARHFFASPPREVNGWRVEAVIGALRDIRILAKEFDTEEFIFCFDHGRPVREDDLPTYKSARKENRKLTEGTDRDHRFFRQQCLTLRTALLQAGYQRVFWQSGFEADDLIAMFAQELMVRSELAVMVSTDKDLYQCLMPTTMQYNMGKKTLMTYRSFQKHYGINSPSLWRMVKAAAGCSSDSIPGIEGVGEITALKWLKGELGEDSKAMGRLKEGADLIKRNLKLTKLPHPDLLPLLDVVDLTDDATPEKWERVMKSLGE